MARWEWFSRTCQWLLTRLHAITRRRTISRLTSSSSIVETSHETFWENLQRDVYCIGEYDLHDPLRRETGVDWPEWHLNIDENGNAIKIAESLQQDFKKLKLSSSIVGQTRTIEETFLESMPNDYNWNDIRKLFKQARQEDNPLVIMRALTRSQQFTECLNKHSAANSYHLLKLYCTVVNCPILARTQEYTEAITTILFHPKLDEFLVRKKTVYRGIILKDKKYAANYKEGATIITTTFLFTSTEQNVSYSFCEGFRDMISIFCTYNISNTCRHTALDFGKISDFTDDREVLILRYVPFIIRSVQQTEDGRKMQVYFDESPEH
ncbi:unnamed protein product [Rotaria sp. Silwood2]|nr:unnamed protein product [Rotaria sp. Silwood2]CAF3383974.1 unnamed protein product [Rotaria sp. Silwood2]CAF4373171.1 unnamed protein product [Rotaria sp. Silwood2]